MIELSHTKVVLLEHNEESYQHFKEKLEHGNLVIFVACPGSGKSYIMLKYLQDYPGDALIICPKNAIANDWICRGREYAVTVEVMTYQKLCRLSKTELLELVGKYKYFIFDECHYVGAPVFGKNPKWLKRNCPDNFYIGLTATPIRHSDHGKDVGKTFFEGNIVEGLSQEEAIEKNIFPGFTYVSGLFTTKEMLNDLRDHVGSVNPGSIHLVETLQRLEYCHENKTEVHEAFDKFMPDSDRKGIVFVDCINNLKEARDIMKSYYGDGENYFIAHSNQKNIISSREIESFKQAPHGWLFVVDMLNEGLHFSGVNTIVMFRRTCSPSLYIQQIGRCQAVGGEHAIIFDFVGSWKSLEDSIDLIASHNAKGKKKKYSRDPGVIADFCVTDAAKLFKDLQRFEYEKGTDEDVQLLKDNYHESDSQYDADSLEPTIDDCTEKAKRRGFKWWTFRTRKNKKRLTWREFIRLAKMYGYQDRRSKH